MSTGSPDRAEPPAAPGVRPRQRAAALGAVLADAVAFLLLFGLILERPVLLVVVVIIGVAFVASSFTVLATRGQVRALAALTAAILGVGEVLVILVWGVDSGLSAWVGPVVIALFVVGSVLGRAARRVAPPASVEVLAHAATAPAPRRPVLIINPRSGGGRAEQFDLVGAATGLGIDTVVLGPDDDLAAIAEAAVGRGADALGMAGGDGSLATVLAVAVHHDLPFVCVPAGTRNHFALDLGLDRNDPRQALTAFVHGEERRVDYATVNGRLFVNNVALGVYAAAVEQDSYRDAKLQTVLGLLPTLTAGGGPWFDLHFDVPDHGRLETAALLMVSNNPYEVGTEIQQRLHLDGGELGIITLNPEKLGDLLGVTLLTATGHADQARTLWAWSAADFVVESGQATMPAGVDGERVALVPPLRFRSHPGAARVLVPAGTRVGLDEQRITTRASYSGLLELAFNLPGAGRGSTPTTGPPTAPDRGAGAGDGPSPAP